MPPPPPPPPPPGLAAIAVGCLVGAIDGSAVGSAVGTDVGVADGADVGVAVGDWVGVAVGRDVGDTDGAAVGAVGADVGIAVGDVVGGCVGAAEGNAVGASVGVAVGAAEGAADGAAEGASVGFAVGARVHCSGSHSPVMFTAIVNALDACSFHWQHAKSSHVVSLYISAAAEQFPNTGWKLGPGKPDRHWSCPHRRIPWVCRVVLCCVVFRTEPIYFIAHPPTFVLCSTGEPIICTLEHMWYG